MKNENKKRVHPKVQKKKVVVTGGAGFIGSHVVDALVQKGFEAHIVDNLSAGKAEHMNKDALFHKIDIRDYGALEDVMRDAIYVFHLAALPRVPYSIEYPRETNEINVGGTLNVLLASQRAGVARVIYSASSSAYGDQPVLPLHEGMSADPKSPYGLQKWIGEWYCKVFSGEPYNLPTVSLRYFNIYGPRQDPEGGYALVIGKFLKMKKEGKPLTITGDGKQTRDFTHVTDAVRANLLAMESSRVGKGEVINIGYGKNASVNKVAELVGGPVEYIAPRIEPKHTRADRTLAKKLLGWEPTISLEEGINDLLRH